MNFEYSEIKACRVIDGDTVELTIDLGFKLTIKEKFRLAGINAPEGKDREAQKWLESKCSDLEVLSATTYKADKYGRWLVTLQLGHINLNRQMIELGLAVPYMEKRDIL